MIERKGPIPESARAAVAGAELPGRAFAPNAADARLLTLYSSSEITHRHIQPRDVGVRAIGHFGFFRQRVRETLWAEAIGFGRGT